MAILPFKKQSLRYFKTSLNLLSHHYTSNDSIRASLAFFALSALDLLDVDTLLNLDPATRALYIDWIYSNQICDSLQLSVAGFRGSPVDGKEFNPLLFPQLCDIDSPHITMTYTALASLLILGDDLSRVKRAEILDSIRLLQNQDGSFIPFPNSPESDLRFAYSACAVCYILNDFSPINLPLLSSYIISCQTHEGGFGQNPLNEAHGGFTYVAIASLNLASLLQTVLPENSQERNRVIYWLVNRQVSGFQGRLNKPPDTCYSFWIGATLTMLGVEDLIDWETNDLFLSTTECAYGGYSKVPADEDDINYPDLLHSYLGLASQAIRNPSQNKLDLQKLDPTLNISFKAIDHMKL
ncbi:Geranylgeranyl transferase type-1 subunit beta, partial [Nowakowskiella sp. JEL0078]